MKRHLLSQLLAWKDSKPRKPLILKGARQVGKTHLLQAFGQQAFRVCHVLNFEVSSELASLFESNLDPHRLIETISFHLDTQIDIQQDLLIFDEIQACPHALTSLKYFHEQMPELALCAAGSLLGVRLTPVSYPVGKVTTLTLHPMSFEEFLAAIGDGRSLDIINQCTSSTKISDIIHDHLWTRLKWYFVTGGLPEVVSTFRLHQDNLFEAMEKVRLLQADLLDAHRADIAKYAGKVNAMHIDRVWNAVPTQLARSQDGSAKKFMCKGVVPGIDRYQRLAGAIDWLEAAGLVLKVPIVETGQLPLKAFVKENVFKLFSFDVGLLGALSGLAPKTILDYQYGTYKGYFAENYVLQSLLVNEPGLMVSWQKNRMEVEFLRDLHGKVIPIEVKSGWVTKARSLQQFAEQYDVPYRVIFSGKPLCIDNEHTVHRYPLYLSGRFPLQS